LKMEYQSWTSNIHWDFCSETEITNYCVFVNK
jgi:hypothetical protein